MFSMIIKNLNISKHVFANFIVNNQINCNLTKTFSIIHSKNYQEQNKSNAQDNSDLDELYKLIHIEVRGHEDAVLDSYTNFIKLTANCLDLTKNLCAIKKPHRFIERWTVLKSKFVHKKKFVQYEMKTYNRVYQFKYLTGSTSSTLLEYIQRNLPAGVSMYVTKTKLECIPESLSKRPLSSEGGDK
jgi:ribosomal protein S10